MKAMRSKPPVLRRFFPLLACLAATALAPPPSYADPDFPSSYRVVLHHAKAAEIITLMHWETPQPHPGPIRLEEVDVPFHQNPSGSLLDLNLTADLSRNKKPPYGLPAGVYGVRAAVNENVLLVGGTWSGVQRVEQIVALFDKAPPAPSAPRPRMFLLGNNL